MRTILPRSAFLLALTILVSACGGSDSSSNLSADCQKVCEITTPLKCPKAPADCVATCQKAAEELPKCQSQVEALMKCEATHPTTDWECDDQGEPSLKNGCDPEGLAVFGCAFGGA
jgi:hypothetical protein